MTPPVHLLIATIPSRRAMCDALLEAVSQQTIVPVQVHLVPDQYPNDDAPYTPWLHVANYRFDTTGGPGGRWRVLRHLPDGVALVVLDDDQLLASNDVIEQLIDAAGTGFPNAPAAAAYRGIFPSGWGGAAAKGAPLIAVACGALACPAAALAGLEATAAEIREKCGFDPWGPLGDDDAVVSFHLWRRGVPMRAAGMLQIFDAPGSQADSQFERRRAAQAADGKPIFWQRRAIAAAFGWPWVEPSVHL
jgi:hypothetical protein